MRAIGFRSLITGTLLAGLLAVPASATATDWHDLPCLMDGLVEPLGIHTRPLAAPGTTSEISFVFPGPDNAQEQRLVAKPDGSEQHTITLTGADGSGGPAWVGTDTYPYHLDDIGPWIMYDAAGQPWRRFMVQAASRLTTTTVPGGIVTAGQTVTVRARLVGWTSAGVESPVALMPITFLARPPAGTTTSTVAPTGSDGTAAVSFRAVSRRDLETFSRHDGCYRYEGAGALQSTLLVRKRITRTVSDSTPAAGQAVRLAGTIYPATATQPVHLQRWNGKNFVTIASATTSSSTGGRYAFSYRPSTRGTQALRVLTPWNAWNVSSASPNAYLKVH